MNMNNLAATKGKLRKRIKELEQDLAASHIVNSVLHEELNGRKPKGAAIVNRQRQHVKRTLMRTARLLDDIAEQLKDGRYIYE